MALHPSLLSLPFVSGRGETHISVLQRLPTRSLRPARLSRRHIPMYAPVEGRVTNGDEGWRVADGMLPRPRRRLRGVETGTRQTTNRLYPRVITEEEIILFAFSEEYSSFEIFYILSCWIRGGWC
ncbi:hypothetical protein LX32DRAFT_103113 [Colletotrichum zoysiae]|uniref:Uncharacterized protein n=1 Tax=Colletotrichum zoysiae TaxID=1216348 RepID=A0AAD9HQL6_9PEZI|nr:hypothetical protein LX32DRAFT_103113 [Colletotrichum zoysiae]